MDIFYPINTQLAPAVCQKFFVGYLHNLGLARLALQRVLIDLMRRAEYLLKMLAVAFSQHDGCAFGDISSSTAGVIHVMVSHYQVFNRLARILGLGRIDRPLRLPLV